MAKHKARSTVATALLVRAEENEARGKVERAYDTLAAAATPETINSFFDALNAVSQEIMEFHLRRVSAIALRDAAVQIDSDQQLTPPDAEAEAAASISAEVLELMRIRYAGAVNADNLRRVLLGQTAAQVAVIRTTDVRGELPEGSPSLYTASRGAFATEVANAINVQASVVFNSALALNGAF